MKVKEDLKIPKVGDVAFKQNDWREECPYIIIDVTKCKCKFLTIKNETYHIYNVFAVNKKREFRKFRFGGNAFIDSRKVRNGSTKEVDLYKKLEQIKTV